MTAGTFVDRHELVGGFSRDRLDEALETLREHRVHNVLVSMCDGSGVSRVKAVAVETFEDAARNGVPYQSGVLSLDNGGAFVPPPICPSRNATSIPGGLVTAPLRRVFVTGHRGAIGSRVAAQLAARHVEVVPRV